LEQIAIKEEVKYENYFGRSPPTKPTASRAVLQNIKGWLQKTKRVSRRLVYTLLQNRDCSGENGFKIETVAWKLVRTAAATAEQEEYIFVVK
jgi:hypothetical protein